MTDTTDSSSNSHHETTYCSSDRVEIDEGIVPTSPALPKIEIILRKSYIGMVLPRACIPRRQRRKQCRGGGGSETAVGCTYVSDVNAESDAGIVPTRLLPPKKLKELPPMSHTGR